MNWTDLFLPRWYRGHLFAFSALDGPTCYESDLIARAVESPDGLEICEPGRCRINFSVPSGSGVVSCGDFFQYGTAENLVSGAFVDTHHLLIKGKVEVISADEEIRVERIGDYTLVGPTSRFCREIFPLDFAGLLAQRSRWILSRNIPASLPASSKSALARAMCLMKGQVCSTEGSIRHRWTTPDRWPHKDMWLWDTAFHAIGWRHIDPQLAMEMIDAMFDLQQPNGFLTYRASVNGPSSRLGDLMTQPPVLAYAAWLVFEITRDLGWLGEIYPKLAAYIRWDLSNRDSDGAGLSEWYIEDDPLCRSSESGMDNSPRFDNSGKFDAVDLNSFLAAECAALALISREIGRLAESENWKLLFRKFSDLINHCMWHEEEQFYCDFDPSSGRPITLLSSAGFLPLHAGIVPKERIASLSRALRDPTLFGTAVPIPSIAAKDTIHYEKDMWRGPVWVNINWLIAGGFERQGFHEDARRIEEATIAEIERCFAEYGTFFEFYDDRRELEPPQLLRKGENAPEKNPFRQVIYDYGWSTTLYVDLLHKLHISG